jgi:hypothetical protein
MPAFEIDDRKFRRAMPAPTSTHGEDLKWSLALFGIVGAFIAWLLYLGWLLLRALI